MTEDEAKAFLTSDCGVGAECLEGSVVTKRVKSWDDFKIQISKLNDFYGFLRPMGELGAGAYEPIFRGHADAKWRLVL